MQFVNNNPEEDYCIKAITALLQGYTCTDSTVLDDRIKENNTLHTAFKSSFDRTGICAITTKPERNS